MNTFLVCFVTAMSVAITMEKCTARYLLIDIGDAHRGSKFWLFRSCSLKVDELLQLQLIMTI